MTVIFLVCDSDFRIYDCHLLYFDCELTHFDRDVSTYDCHSNFCDCDNLPIDVMAHQYCAIISPTSRVLLLLTVMKTYVITSLIHNFSDKSIPDTRLHSFNIVSTISGTSVQGA